MRINKVDPFYTDQDRAILAGYERQIEACLNEGAEIDERLQNAGQDELGAILSEREANTFRRLEIESARDAILQNIEQRYIDSFKDEPARILDDIQEIVEAIEKDEYLASHNRRAELLKPLLKDKPGKGSSPEQKEQYRTLKQLSVRGYSTCYFYILTHIRVQLNALAYYNDTASAEKAEEIVKAKTETFYQKPKNAEEIRVLDIERSLPIVRGASARGDFLSRTSYFLFLL